MLIVRVDLLPSSHCMFFISIFLSDPTQYINCLYTLPGRKPNEQEAYEIETRENRNHIGLLQGQLY